MKSFSICDGEEDLVDLAAETLFRSEEDLLGELLRQRRRTLRAATLDDVLDDGAEDRFRIDAAVAIKLGILRGHDGLHEQRRHVALRDDDALLDRVLGEGNAVAVEDAGDDRRLIIGEFLHRRHTHGVREEKPGRNAEHRADEQNEDPQPVARRLDPRDELVVHGCSLSCAPLGYTTALDVGYPE